eukprot:CAMPEP_0184326040 /NCGR_PEP_ID=MMETSP1049-20130417/142350_1 /TAXON_ID=77928 /ORGANISM="Proteomonas sulcata, Strain CCMP704" /LENGTH=122 /DNA_ID=CAMNT_0026648209 /DNA_START=353 /DNA_END=722 /DNA_ORIENTATION=+
MATLKVPHDLLALDQLVRRVELSEGMSKSMEMEKIEVHLEGVVQRGSLSLMEDAGLVLLEGYLQGSQIAVASTPAILESSMLPSSMLPSSMLPSSMPASSILAKGPIKVELKVGIEGASLRQ